MPSVLFPDCFSTTAVGPALHFSVPSVGCVVEGRLKTGPTPQMSPSERGARKNEVRMSPTPKADVPPLVSGGWLTNGVITRRIRFQSSVSWNGMTGCTFRMNRVARRGRRPAPS